MLFYIEEVLEQPISTKLNKNRTKHFVVYVTGF